MSVDLDNPLFDPAEALPRPDLEALQSRRLREVVARLDAVPFYRDAFRERGLDPHAVRGLEDLRRLPFPSNFGELITPDDTAATARALGFDAPATGTILSIPTAAGAAGADDIDWYRFTEPTSAGRVFETKVTVRFPASFRGIFVDHRTSFFSKAQVSATPGSRSTVCWPPRMAQSPSR